MEESGDETNLIALIRDAMSARSPEELEVGLRRVMRHPDLDEAEHMEFYSVWEELSDTLLQRWLDLIQQLDEVAYAALHRRNALPAREEGDAGQ